MKKEFDTYRPPGFHTITSYLMVDKPGILITFLKKAFFAEELSRTLGADHKTIKNCILKIGNSCFMIAQASPPFEGMRTTHYLYVADVDTMHQNALQAGALEFFPPSDMDYGDRQSGITDPSGSYWWISKRLKEEDYSS